jgi:hypothetical protein
MNKWYSNNGIVKSRNPKSCTMEKQWDAKRETSFSRLFRRTTPVLMALLAGVLWAMPAPSRCEEQMLEPESEMAQVQETDMVTGWVDAVHEGVVVINDMSTPLSAVTLYDQKGFRRDPSSLAVDRYVAFKKEDGKLEIHLLDQKVKRPRDSVPSSADKKTGAQKEAVRQVNGVWKN